MDTLDHASNSTTPITGHTSVKNVLFFILLVLLAISGILYVAIRKQALTKNGQGPSCDMSLWAHVYHGRFQRAEDRLHIVNPCITVSGIIMNARRERDGDWHIQLDLDSEFASLLNRVI